jgi:nucleoside 2-deoxyribosyltransferase
MDPYGPLEREDLAPIDLNELLERWPHTVPERIDRTLCNLARLSPTGGHVVEVGYEDTSLAFAETSAEAQYHINSLIRREYVEVASRINLALTLTADGWERFQQLTRGASTPENPAFVAMWFGDEDQRADMNEAYERGIHAAIGLAGYRDVRVDLVEHNEWIMDKVLGDIRLAPFVVADFTGHRNGVYFEAGFARGRGITVIHTCRKNDFGQAHFDTKQLNHVLWENPDELRERLYDRIMGTVGRGPHPPRADVATPL